MAAPFCSCKRRHAEGDQYCARFERWFQLSKAQSLQTSGRYAELLDMASLGSSYVSAEQKRDLGIDVERTCTLSAFQECQGNVLLTNVLTAWVVYDKLDVEASQHLTSGEAVQVVGYVQGMNFLALVLLWHSGNDEAAFWVFVAMMKHYGLRCMFAPPDMPGIKMRSFTIAQLLRQSMPDLSDHLAEYLKNQLGLLLTEWLLTLFASSMPLGPLAVFWDQFFDDGYCAVYRLILARLRCLRPWLLAETDFAQLIQLLKFSHVEFDCSSGTPMPFLTPSGSLGPQPFPSGQSNDQLSGGKPRKPNIFKKLFGGGSAKQSNAPEGPTVPQVELERRSVENNDAEHDPESSQGAWTCWVCNAGESCYSWHTHVSVLLPAERIPSDTIIHFEHMFGGVTLVGGCSPAPANGGHAGNVSSRLEAALETSDGSSLRPSVNSADQQASSSSSPGLGVRAESGDAPAKLAEVQAPACLSLEAENAQLHLDNKALTNQLNEAQNELVELRRKLAEAQSEIASLKLRNRTIAQSVNLGGSRGRSDSGDYSRGYPSESL